MMQDDKREADNIAREVAPLLGEGWQLDNESDHWATIINGPDGARLYLSVGRYGKPAGKITVSGSVTHLDGYDYGNHSHLAERAEINVAISRGAAVIAREIERRLLPDYLANLATMREAIAKTRANNDAAGQVGREIAARLRTTYTGPDDRYARESHEVRWSGEGYGSIEINHDGTRASVELRSLPLDIVRDIVAALAPHAPGSQS